MIGTITKTLVIEFSMREVEFLKEVLADPDVMAIAEKKYGHEWARILLELRNIFVNSSNP